DRLTMNGSRGRVPGSALIVAPVPLGRARGLLLLLDGGWRRRRRRLVLVRLRVRQQLVLHALQALARLLDERARRADALGRLQRALVDRDRLRQQHADLLAQLLPVDLG